MEYKTSAEPNSQHEQEHLDSSEKQLASLLNQSNEQKYKKYKWLKRPSDIYTSILEKIQTISTGTNLSSDKKIDILWEILLLYDDYCRKCSENPNTEVGKNRLKLANDIAKAANTLLKVEVETPEITSIKSEIEERRAKAKAVEGEANANKETLLSRRETSNQEMPDVPVNPKDVDIEASRDTFLQCAGAIKQLYSGQMYISNELEDWELICTQKTRDIQESFKNYRNSLLLAFSPGWLKISSAINSTYDGQKPPELITLIKNCNDLMSELESGIKSIPQDKTEAVKECIREVKSVWVAMKTYFESGLRNHAKKLQLLNYSLELFMKTGRLEGPLEDVNNVRDLKNIINAPENLAAQKMFSPLLVDTKLDFSKDMLQYIQFQMDPFNGLQLDDSANIRQWWAEHNQRPSYVAVGDSFFDSRMHRCNHYEGKMIDVNTFDTSHVKQAFTPGFTLDCTLLATISSLAVVNKDVLEKCFVRQADDNITIRLWGKNAFELPTPVYITVKKTSWKTLSIGESWVRMLEKAFSIYFAKGYDWWANPKTKSKKVQNYSFTHLAGLNEGVCMFALTGEDTQTINSDSSLFSFPVPTRDKETKKQPENEKKFSSLEYTNARKELFEKIKNSLSNGSPVVTGDCSGSYLSMFSKKGIMGFHGYAVVGIEDGQKYKYIFVRDPFAGAWATRDYNKIPNESSESTSRPKAISKHDRPKTSEQSDTSGANVSSSNAQTSTDLSAFANSGGVAKLELNDFCNCFSAITFLKGSDKAKS